MSGRKDETNNSLVHRFSIMVCFLLWPETMCTRESVGAREVESETHTAAAGAVRASDIGAENGCRVL